MDEKSTCCYGRHLVAVLAASLTCAVAPPGICADAVTAPTPSASEMPSYKDICVADQLADAKTDTPADTAKKASLRSACASYQMQVLANLSGSAKLAPVEQALSAIAALPHLEGTLSSPAAADHIGQALSQLVLADAVRAVATEIVKVPDWTNLKSVLVLSQSDIDNRIQVGAATNWLYYVDYSLNYSARVLSDEVSDAQRAMEQRRKVAISKPEKVAEQSGLKRAKSLESVTVTGSSLMFIPLGISAAEAVAGAMKINVTLAPITAAPKAEVIFSALASNPNVASHLYFPGVKTDWGVPDAIGDGLPSGFGSAFAQLVTDIEAGQSSLNLANAEIAKEGGEKKAFGSLVQSASDLKAQITKASLIVDQYQTVSQGRTQSPYQEVMTLAAKVAPPGTDAVLVITPSTFGAHGGVITSQWRSQRLAYDADMVITYALVNAKGGTLAAGTMYGSGHTICGADEDCLATAIITTSTSPSAVKGNGSVR